MSFFSSVSPLDGTGPVICQEWGELGIPGIPIVIDSQEFTSWFFNPAPGFAILSEDMIILNKYNILDFDVINVGIQQAIDNCPECGETGIDISTSDLFVGFALHQNYPNPFNPVTTISYSLPVSSHVRITIHDLKGRVVDELVTGRAVAGTYSVEWDASGVSSGIYIYRIESSGFTQTRKLVLLK